MKILNFGSCNIDSVYSVENIVKPGETIAATTLNKYPGGKGLNQSIALARSGAEVYHAGCVGGDDDMLKPLLEKNGVNTRYLQVVDDMTGQAIIQVEKSGENSIFLYHGANFCVTEKYIDEVLVDFEKGDILLLQNEISNIPYLVKKGAELGLRIVLNPSPFNSVIKDIDLKDIYCLILNRTEVTGFSETDEIYDFLSFAKNNYPDLRIVLTLGKDGCIYQHKDTYFHYPAYKIKAVDTTAAGDTFTGYFVSKLLEDGSPRYAVRHASAAAGISATRNGAAPSIPLNSEVIELMKNMEFGEADNAELTKTTVYSYLSQNLKTANLEELADILGFSITYTSKWIAKNMEASFSQLLQKERCIIAAQYLRNTDMPIGDIIKNVGYENESHFRKIFSSSYGILPLEYRKTKGGR